MERVRTYGCLHSEGHCTVSAYLQVEISVIELIIALGSEHTNLTYNKNMKSIWWGTQEKTQISAISYLSLSWLICKIACCSISILMSMIPEWTNIIKYLFLSQHMWNHFSKLTQSSTLHTTFIHRDYLWEASFERGSFNVEISERFSLYAAVASGSYSPKTNSWTTCNRKILNWLSFTWIFDFTSF